MKPLSSAGKESYSKEAAADGKLVWQKYNCQSCHQLFGLGGYLGPDLTNIISEPNKGETVLKAMVKTGTKQMPAFNLSDNEMKLLVDFLRAADGSGKADPRTFEKNNLGMIESHESK